MSWAFPDPAVRRECSPWFFLMAADPLLPDGLCWRADGAAALWALPDRWRESPLDVARLGARCLAGVGRRAPLVVFGLSRVEARHPSEPHAYLATVGVRPSMAGQGLGSALLSAGLAEVDTRGLPAFLESSNPRNVPLYERHGFVVTGSYRLPRGPELALMWREARA